MMDAEDIVTFTKEPPPTSSASAPQTSASSGTPTSQLDATMQQEAAPTDAARRRDDEHQLQQVVLIEDSPTAAPLAEVPKVMVTPSVSGAPGSHPTPAQAPAPWPLPLPRDLLFQSPPANLPIQYGTPMQQNPDPVPAEQPRPSTPPRAFGPDDDTDLASLTPTPVASPDRSRPHPAAGSQGGLTTPTQPMSPIRFRISTPIRSASAPRSGPYSTPRRNDRPERAHRRSRTAGPSRKASAAAEYDQPMQDADPGQRSPSPLPLQWEDPDRADN